MTSAQVRHVLLEDCPDLKPALKIEDRADGSAVVRDSQSALTANGDRRTFPVSDTLHRCANLLSDAGFVVALVRDKDGVYLNAH